MPAPGVHPCPREFSGEKGRLRGRRAQQSTRRKGHHQVQRVDPVWTRDAHAPTATHLPGQRGRTANWLLDDSEGSYSFVGHSRGTWLSCFFLSPWERQVHIEALMGENDLRPGTCFKMHLQKKARVWPNPAPHHAGTRSPTSDLLHREINFCCSDILSPQPRQR